MRETENQNGLKAAMSYNENLKPNSGLLHTLKSVLPEFFEKDILDEEGNILEQGAFKSDKFLEELEAHNIAESRDGYKLGFVGKDYARLQTGRRSETMIAPDSKHNALPENKDSGNIFITGDNMDALRHLVNAYENRIKLIYIDPPYNTGKEFVYKDTFEYTDKELRCALGYNDKEIARLKSIQGKSSHSAWLTFMYPRLKIAQKLLTPDGVIFISIDDNEQANLKLLMDEVFGEGNFVSEFIWKKKQGGGNDSSYVVIEHEYIITYCKNIQQCKLYLDKKYKLDDGLYPNKDEMGEYGLVTLDKASIQFSQSLVFEIVDKKGNKYYPRIVKGKQSCWRWSKAKVESDFESLVFKDGKVYTKYYRPTGITPKSLLVDTIYGRTETGNDDIKTLFEIAPFSYPKPVVLLDHFIEIASKNDDLILDFFAGSATTAHAVMQLNAEDGGNRKYIMVQCKERTWELDANGKKIPKKNNQSAKTAFDAGYMSIDQISRERIKRAGAKILKDYTEKETANAGELPLADEQAEQKWDKDIGFKHYCLKPVETQTLDKIETFDPSAPVFIAEDMILPFAHPATETSGIKTLLTTWLIDDGFTFDTPVEPLDFADYTAYLVQSKLYLIAPEWGSAQTKDLLNRIGKNELNVQHIVVYGYSFLMESLRELEINIKNTLDADHRVYIERRY